MPDIRITDNPDAGRFEIYCDDALAGFAEYTLAPDRVVFTHTEVDDAYEGHGLASKLIRYALDDMRDRGLRVVPRCPFVRKFIEEHQEYAELVH